MWGAESMNIWLLWSQIVPACLLRHEVVSLDAQTRTIVECSIAQLSLDSADPQGI